MNPIPFPPRIRPSFALAGLLASVGCDPLDEPSGEDETELTTDADAQPEFEAPLEIVTRSDAPHDEDDDTSSIIALPQPGESRVFAASTDSTDVAARRPSCRAPRGEITGHRSWPVGSVIRHEFSIKNVGLVDAPLEADFSDYNEDALPAGGFIYATDHLVMQESATYQTSVLPPTHPVSGTTITARGDRPGGGVGCTGHDSRNHLYELEIRRGWTGEPWRISGRLEWWSHTSRGHSMQIEYQTDDGEVLGRMYPVISFPSDNAAHGSIAYFDMLILDPPVEGATRLGFYDADHTPLSIIH